MKTLVFGAGVYGRRYLESLRNSSASAGNVVAFLDNKVQGDVRLDVFWGGVAIPCHNPGKIFLISTACFFPEDALCCIIRTIRVRLDGCGGATLIRAISCRLIFLRIAR